MLEDLVAWVGLPLLLYGLSLGQGFLVERVAGFRVPNGLVAPLGFCALVLVSMAVFRLQGTGWVAAGLAVVLAAAGLVWARADLPARLNAGWPLAAGAAAYALFVAPIALSGGWTWAGYNFVNDTAIFFLLVDHLQAAGTSEPAFGRNMSDNAIRAYLVTDYPIGTQAALATLGKLLFVRVEVYFQPFIAALAGLGAMALTALGRHLVRAHWAALAAVVAISANLVYQFALQGAVKEIGVVTTLAIAAALGRELLDDERPRRAVVGVALAFAASLTVFSTPAGPYVVFMALALLVLALLRRDRPLRAQLWWTAAIGAAVLLVVSLPTLFGLAGFGRTASGVFSPESGASQLGQLARPLLLSQLAGVWIGDYTYPIEDQRALIATTVLIALVGVAFVAGLVLLARRREPGPLLLLVPAILALLLLAPRVTAYADAKMMVILSVPVVLVALLGAVGLEGVAARLGWLGAALAVAATAGVVLSDAQAYREVRLAPIERMQALRDAGRHLDQKGPVGANEAEEFTKYLVRKPQLEQGSEAFSPSFNQPRAGAIDTLAWIDLDDQALEYVQRFSGWLQRRSPAASRPPANFARVHRNAYYDVWARRRGPEVIDHLPLQGRDRRALTPAECRAVGRLAREAARPGRELLAAERPEVALFEPLDAERPERGWPPNGNIRQPGTVTMTVPGRAGGSVRLRGGRYRMWTRGTFGRPVTIWVDGRRVATAQGVDTAMQYHRGPWIDLSPGRHRVEVRREGGNLKPGDAARSWLGPVAFEAAGETRVVRVDPAQAEDLCDRRLDWIEVVESG